MVEREASRTVDLLILDRGTETIQVAFEPRGMIHPLAAGTVSGFGPRSARTPGPVEIVYEPGGLSLWLGDLVVVTTEDGTDLPV
jgi:hypothetical protein